MRSSSIRLPLLLTLVAGISLMLAGSARAQTGIYGTVSASNFNTPNVDWQYGSTFGVYHDFLHVPFVSAGIDARAQLLGSGTSKVDSGLVGPHIQLHPHLLPLMPYAEGLIGGASVHLGQGLATTDKTGLAYEGAAGIDWTILPRFDWRVVEFSYEGVSGLSASEVSPRTLSTGIVFRIPFL